MSDPTGRHHDETTAGAPAGDEHAPLPTDVGERPLAEIPRPFTREAMDFMEQQVKDAILRMGSMVSERILGAIDALEQHDAEGALRIITTDDQLNEEQERISGLVVETIAREQPVARDLRFLMALDHVAYDLERMGDHASSVAKQARKLAPHAPLQEHVRLPELGRLVAQQVRDILTAVVDVDEQRAREIAAGDDAVDELYHTIFAETLELMRADPANVDPGARILFAAHYLERCGDRVTNIAEDIVFLATGEVEDLNP
ncbi:MAG TPA: phosphate signaling complex protein PhoU [Anaerolineae bacterium]|nr:phosphate signaling complex protein PhoU [Anaerolineae bacterium]